MHPQQLRNNRRRPPPAARPEWTLHSLFVAITISLLPLLLPPPPLTLPNHARTDCYSAHSLPAGTTALGTGHSPQLVCGSALASWPYGISIPDIYNQVR